MSTAPAHVPEPTVETVVAWLRPLIEPGGVVELRILGAIDNANYPPFTAAGYFDEGHLDSLAKLALAWTGKAEGVYVTLNPLGADMLALASNRVKRKPKATAADGHVLRRIGLVFDADPRRSPSGISSTDDEKAFALERILALRDDLTGRGWPAPILADSGNGYHLRYRVDLPAEDGGLVERVLKAADARFSDDRVAIDAKLFNPARIIKLYGTMSRKGDSTPGRPHRWTCVLEGPTRREEFVAVPRDLLEAMAAEAAPRSAPAGEAGDPGDSIWPMVAADGARAADRARAYVFARGFPDAIEGQFGHGRLYHVACVLVDGFGLSEAEAYPIFAEWNAAKAKPPESEKQLRHKLADAIANHPKPSYGLLNAPRHANVPAAQASGSEARGGPPKVSYPRLEPGQCVMAVDRPEGPNFGFVLADEGDRALIHFRPGEEFEARVLLHKSDLRTQDGTPLAPVEGADGWPLLRLHTLPSAPPFPVEVFPPALRDYCREAAEALSVPTDFIGAPMLAVAGAAIGQSVNIRVKAGWDEAPLVYLILIARPGRTKSPAIATARRPLAAIDQRLRKQSEADRERWEEQRQAYQKEPKGNEPPGPEPPQRRAIVKDITRESLVVVLKDNPRGILNDPDEATAWVARFNEYKAGGADRQFWLSNWSCDPVSVDRKGGRESTYIPHPFIAVLGGIPPAMLGSLSEERGRDDGFLDRILFAFPDDSSFPRQRWTEVELSETAEQAWSGAIDRLHSLDMIEDPEAGEPSPHRVTFTAEAKREWVAWYDAHEAETEAPDLAERHGGAWSKMRAHAARFCLILARLRQVSDPAAPREPGPIEADDVRGAVALVDFFKGHLLKTSHHASGGLNNPDARAVAQWITRHRLRTFNEAKLKEHLRRFRTDPAALADALAELTTAGVIRSHQAPPADGPGRKPSPAWEVNPAFLGAPENSENSGNAPGPEAPVVPFSEFPEFPGAVAGVAGEAIER